MKNQKQRPEVMKVRKTRKSTRGMAAKALLISAAFSAGCCMSVFAGQWMQIGRASCRERVYPLV